MNEYLELWKGGELPEVRKYDAFTRQWFAAHPDAIETFSQCETCRLFMCNPRQHRCEELKE